MTAERREIAFAGDPALVPGHSVIQIAADSGAAAARRGAPPVASADQVLESAAGVIADLGVAVVARAAGREQPGTVQVALRARIRCWSLRLG